MMEQDLRTRLMLALPGIPVEWGWSGQGSSTPRVVLQMVSEVTSYTYSGPLGYIQNRVQIDIYAPTHKAVKEAEVLVDTALSGLRAGLILGAFKDGRRDSPPDLGAGETLARISIDYMIHHNQE
jgi:hypothetical protein